MVRFNLPYHNIIYDYKKYNESGILCYHCLRIFNVHCVPKVSDQYILKHWTRPARPLRVVKEPVSGNAFCVPDSIWRIQIHRQFKALLLARQLCEEVFAKLKVDVGVVVDSAYVYDTENDQQSSASNQIIGNLKGFRKKGQRNVRRKSTSEKISNIVRSRKAMFSLRNGGDISQPQVKFY